MDLLPQNLRADIKELKKMPYVSAIILFGSRACGTAREDSDFDIAVVTENATKEQEFSLLKKEGGVDINVFSRLAL